MRIDRCWRVLGCGLGGTNNRALLRIGREVRKEKELILVILNAT